MLKKWKDLPDFMKCDEVREYYEILEKRKFSIFLKRVFDLIAGTIMFIILAIPMVILAIWIKLDSPGPVFYRQERITSYGKHFRIHKFRTMIANADKIGTAVTVENDSRITKVGAKLRKHRFDVEPVLLDLFRQQYTLTVQPVYEEVTETRTVQVGESLGTVVTSGYCNCVLCCGIWAGGNTASGVPPASDHTIAVDASDPIVSMGTKVVMNGVEYTVEDTGNFKRYGVDFDIYYDSHAEALAHGHQSVEAYLSDSNGSSSIEVTETTTKKILNITLKKVGFHTVAGNNLTRNQRQMYDLYNATLGNRSYLFSAYDSASDDYASYTPPAEALSDERFANMLYEAEKYLGVPYVWGGYSPAGFDCSGFLSYVINHCGNGWDVGRLTANGLKDLCTPVPPEEAKPGDLIFFQGTYQTSGASHVGMIVGDGMMIHCGSPVQYTSYETSYWQSHFLSVGRLP